MNRIRHQEDGTLARKTVKQMLFLIQEYELIKQKKHPKFKFVTEFYRAYNLTRQNFIKYYNRFKNCRNPLALLPQKRGPEIGSRIPGFIQEKVINLRFQGANKFEIYQILKPKLKKFTPSVSTIYGIMRRNNLNKLHPKTIQKRRMIIKEKAGELGHIDCHYLPTGLIQDDQKRYYLVAVVDSCTRIVWAEIVKDIKSLTVMFATLKSFNLVNELYSIKYEEVLTDNGPEFGSGKKPNNQMTSPFKRMLYEMGVKQRFTRPFRPQTNGKVERFWKTLHYDLIDGVVFDSYEHFEQSLQEYILYYNEVRPHQGINGKTPKEFNESCHRNS